jgi:pyrimidine operon attenuation protein/uracil phosphoribosyltransferase
MARKTIFQQLNDLFGPEIKRPGNKSRYSLGDKELLKTKSKEEYDFERLKQQQDKYLSGMWQKVDNEIYQHSIYYETTRLASYADFEGMEFFPEIAAALDIMMEESTTLNPDNKVINIFSESKRVRRILEDLFFNRLDIHTTLPMWTRNTCKYGDNFLFLNIDSEEGITGVKQLPNIEISRKDNEGFGENATNAEDDSFNPVKFVWGQRDIEFNAWQIAHFRLLGDDRRLPYGTSMLEKARRIWKQLLLSEDAMLIYRVTRAPERRIFKIFVGNIDEQDVPAYVQKIADNFKKSPVIDQNTGQIDTRYNQMAQDQDYFIPVRDVNAPSPIDTLPGATNLSEIADIQYLQKKLFTALRVPKPFLGFEDVTGEGKNLALQDIRFARTINRIQQSMLQELNKVAIIHLYILGLEDELENFTLSLNNPSTQAEMLKIEQTQMKVTLYKDAVTDAGNGFGAMSMTRGKKEILGMSDEEIRNDLEQQRLEKAAAAEMEQTSNIIKKTGIFDRVDKLYGDFDVLVSDGEAGEAGTEEGAKDEFGGDTGGDTGGFGGGGFGADLEDVAATEAGGEAAAAETETAVESTNKKENLLMEENKRRYEEKTKRYQNIYLKRLTESLKNNEHIYDLDSVEKDTHKLNSKIEDMTKEIDKIIKD